MENLVAYIRFLSLAGVLVLSISANSQQPFENNTDKKVIENLFDSIGTKIINWIIEDRYKPSKIEKPNIPNSSRLDDIREIVKKHELILKHVDSVISYRNKSLESLESKDENEFKQNLKNFLNSRFYKKEILAEYDNRFPQDKKKYNDNKEKIHKYVEDKINKAISDFQNLKSEEEEIKSMITVNSDSLVIEPFSNIDSIEITDENELYTKIIVENNPPFYKKAWPWLSLLAFASILLNIILYLSRNDLLKRHKSLKNEFLRQESTLNNPSLEQKTTSSTLSKIEIKQLTEKEYQKLKERLIVKYQSPVFNTQKLKFETLTNQTFDDIQNKTFKTKEEFSSFLKALIQNHESILENELDQYLSRDKAISEIKSLINEEEFITPVNSNFISESDIKEKVEQYKNNLISDLPDTITIDQLNSDIQDLKKSLVQYFEKIVKSHLEIYLPFTDDRGTVPDEKRSNIINSYSALKLTINPDDITKANFQLLYNQEEMMKAAVLSYDVLLMPVCILKPDNFNRNGNKIEQIGPDGTMKLEDGIWKVVNKIEIRII